jgi:hypothetical protein
VTSSKPKSDNVTSSLRTSELRMAQWTQGQTQSPNKAYTALHDLPKLTTLIFLSPWPLSSLASHSALAVFICQAPSHFRVLAYSVPSAWNAILPSNCLVPPSLSQSWLRSHLFSEIPENILFNKCYLPPHPNWDSQTFFLSCSILFSWNVWSSKIRWCFLSPLVEFKLCKSKYLCFVQSLELVGIQSIFVKELKKWRSKFKPEWTDEPVYNVFKKTES